MRRTWIILVCVVAVVAGAVLLLRHTIHASIGYTVMAEFSTMPKDDSGLRHWLHAQPGVVSAWTCRTNRTLKVLVVMSRSLAGSPKIPDLASGCSSLGYSGQDARFQDCEKTEPDGAWISDD